MSKQKAKIAPIISRIKAFIIDMFIILMPILYAMTYLVLGSKEQFNSNQLAILICQLLFGVIMSAFFAISAQTPGYKAQQIYLIDLSTGRKLSFVRAFLRFVLFVVAGASVVGLLICFFRKDRLNLHDLLSHTAPVVKKQA